MGVAVILAGAKRPMMAAAVVVAHGVAGCGATGASQHARPQPPRARAYVDTFDRILIAGFVAGHVSNRGHLDINEETARVLRMTLRPKGGLDVIESQPLELRRTASTGADTDGRIFADVAFWKRQGEEYRDPLILTGAVVFKGAGSQYEERTMRTAHRASVTSRIQSRTAFGIHQRPYRGNLGFAVAGTCDWSSIGRTDIRARLVLRADGQAHAIGAGGARASEQCRPYAIERDGWPRRVKTVFGRLEET